MFDYEMEYNHYWLREDRWGESSFTDPEVLVDNILTICGSGRLLDVGCGMGLLVRTLLSHGVDAYGIDIASVTIKEANRFSPNRYKLGSILNIPYPEAFFETVCSTDCLEHLTEEDIPQAINELFRVTKRYAFIRLSTAMDRDNRWHLTVRSRNWWETKFFEAGFRKHSLFFEIISYEELENESGTITLVFEKIPPQIAIKYTLPALLAERTLHMDMLRESGRRSEAHCLRYSLFKWHLRHNDVVLDVACGLGYGSAILWDSSLASKVIGIDNSDFAIQYAKENYCFNRPGLEFLKGDVQDLSSFADNSIDLVISFETVEHLHEPDKFLSEVYRVLVPGGRFICSVPNMWVDETGIDPNPYHHHVFDFARLKALCEKHFLVEEVYSQVAGGGMKLKEKGRKITKVPVTSDNRSVEAEWWLLVGMKDPLVGRKEDYRETSFPNTTDHVLNLVSWGRDYENPWIVRSLVHVGWRLKSQEELTKLSNKVLEYSSLNSPDRGAALCVLGYRLLESKDTTGNYREWLINELRTYTDCMDDVGSANPHVVRWKISNQYLIAKLNQASGDLSAAATEFWKCAQMDFSGFSPLIATKTVDAAFQAGWLFLNTSGNQEMTRKAWEHGVKTAQRALTSPWDEIIGDFKNPYDFGLREATQILDFATKCANGLFYLKQLHLRPGKLTSLASSTYCEAVAKSKDRQIAEKDRQLAEEDRQLAEKDRQIAEKCAEQDRQIEAFLNSYSWKATAPLRKVLGLFKK